MSGVIEPELNEEQELMLKTVETLLERNYGREGPRKLASGERNLARSLKRELAEKGIAALLVPSELGGLELGIHEASLVCRAAGKVLAPLGLLTCHLASTNLLRRLPSSERLRTVFKRIVDGETLLPVLSTNLELGLHSAIKSSDGYEFSFEGIILDHDLADMLLVVTREEGNAHLFVIDADVVKDSIKDVECFDPSVKAGIVKVNGLEVGREALVGELNAEQLRSALSESSLMVASELLGISEALLEKTVSYLKEREAFGRSVASFQAIKHRTVDMLLKVEMAKSLTFLAESPEDSLSAKIYAGNAAVRLSLEAIQLHGGIGFTWEGDVHFYLRRAMLCNNLLIGAERALKLKSLSLLS